MLILIKVRLSKSYSVSTPLVLGLAVFWALEGNGARSTISDILCYIYKMFSYENELKRPDLCFIALIFSQYFLLVIVPYTYSIIESIKV